MTVVAAARTDPDALAMGALARMAQGLLSGRAELSYGTAKQGFRELVARDPMDAVLVTALGGAWLFYLAERDANPKVRSYWDALMFITTCLSVGYADVFARTDSGKAIASFVMTVGPALSSALLEPPAATPVVLPATDTESLAVQKAILDRLEAILAALTPRA